MSQSYGYKFWWILKVLFVFCKNNLIGYKIHENSEFIVWNWLLDPMSKIIFRCLVHSGLRAAEPFLILLSWLSPHEIFMQLIWCVTDKSLVRTSGTSMLKLLLLKKAILGWWLFQYLSMFGTIARCLLLIKAPSISNQHIFSTDFLKTLKKCKGVKQNKNWLEQFLKEDYVK